ncbi:MAG: phosphatase PAP2 family protein [Gemmatimonadaceae bacterium]
MKLIRVCLLLLIAAAEPLRAQAASDPPSLFTRNDAIWSVAVLLGSVALSSADARIAQGWVDSTMQTPGKQRWARNFSKLQEGSLTFGNLALWSIGRLTGQRAMADITFHAAEAVVVGSVAAQLVRGPLGRSRPHVTDYKDAHDFRPFRGFRDFNYRAFPSIHTASAFAVATVYTLETKRRAPGAVWIVGPVAYAIAAGPGISRMFTGQHWASDVLAGAFVGTLAGAKVVRYNHVVRPNNGVNRFFLGADGVQVSSDAVSMTYSFRF